MASATKALDIVVGLAEEGLTQNFYQAMTGIMALQKVYKNGSRARLCRIAQEYGPIVEEKLAGWRGLVEEHGKLESELIGREELQRLGIRAENPDDYNEEVYERVYFDLREHETEILTLQMHTVAKKLAEISEFFDVQDDPEEGRTTLPQSLRRWARRPMPKEALDLVIAYMQEGLSNNFVVAMEGIQILHTVCRTPWEARLRYIGRTYRPIVVEKLLDWRTAAHAYVEIRTEVRARWRAEDDGIEAEDPEDMGDEFYNYTDFDFRLYDTAILVSQLDTWHNLIEKVAQFFNTEYDTDDSDFEDLMDDHAIHESLVKWAREV